MKNSRSLSVKPNHQEIIGGFVYLIFEFVFLPSVLSFVNWHLRHPLNDAELNFAFYLINFIATVLIFHKFLGQNLKQVTQHPAIFCQAVVLSLVAYYACSWVVAQAVALLAPGFSNYNDQTIATMLDSNYILIAISTVILVPPAEECLFRGLIFRNLYGKSRWAAYIVSILAFAAIHIVGYIGSYSAVEMLIAFLQYLPAGLCLAWAYAKADTIFAPIVMHAIINCISIQSLL